MRIAAGHTMAYWIYQLELWERANQSKTIFDTLYFEQSQTTFKLLYHYLEGTCRNVDCLDGLLYETSAKYIYVDILSNIFQLWNKFLLLTGMVQGIS